MSDNSNPSPPIQSPFGGPNRYTTTHDPSTHQSIFSRTLPEPLTGYGAAGMVVFDSYKTFIHPPFMSDESDIAQPASPPLLLLPFSLRGTTESCLVPRRGRVAAPVLRLGTRCDFCVSQDGDDRFLGVCAARRMELTLDSREVRVLGGGDTIVQRGTMHAWRNQIQAGR
ncbi:hypothetical protein C8A00DRAFT_36813 [Chaetomidium leptoderma]|uniref:Uncharacterized protein n=1 Tax=Chaetomidium leptoderma TaxID=669021 RepID=A0AAN6VFL0_9PEZI|nr:hypothetical protein C8A00DRAFT_36813 [Chaetomidium leptoderma]